MNRDYLIISIAFILLLIPPGSAMANSTIDVNTIIKQATSSIKSSNTIQVETNTGGKSKTHIEVNGKSYDYEDAGSVSVINHNGDTKITVDGKEERSPEVNEQISKAQEKVTEVNKQIEEKKKEIEKDVEEKKKKVEKQLEDQKNLLKSLLDNFRGFIHFIF